MSDMCSRSGLLIGGRARCRAALGDDAAALDPLAPVAVARAAPVTGLEKMARTGRQGDLVDVVERWSVRIAQRVAPAEADFAAEVGAAYAAGGKARKELVPRPGVQPGAFGLGELGAYLPVVLRAVADAGSALLALLGSSFLGNGLAAGSLMVALRAARGGKDGPGGHPATAGTGPPSVPEGQVVVLAFESLRGRLKAAGFPPDQASALAFELLEELRADPADAAAFVRALSAVPDGTVPPEGTKGRHARRGGGR